MGSLSATIHRNARPNPTKPWSVRINNKYINMKALVIIIASIVVIQDCHAAPAPQRGVVVEDDVELVPAENTNTRHPEGGFPLSGGNGDFPVIIIRTSSKGRNPLQAILNDFFGNAREETDHNNDRVPKIPDEEIPEIPLSELPDLSTILGDLPNTGGNNGGDVASDEFFPSFPSIFRRGQNSDGERCGLLCTMLSGFDKQLKTIEEEVREIRDKQKEKENEIPQGDESENEGPVNEYTEEILPDGTMVKTNKTYHTSEDGTSYYSFQSTSVRKGYGNSDVPVERIPDVPDKQSEDSNEQEEREETTERVREEFENVGVDDGFFDD